MASLKKRGEISSLPAAESILRSTLVAWFEQEKRAMPWRADPTPYKVWVSEIMLQQTRVETVIPYFQRFLSSFPDVHALANASLDEVLSRWSGLGYYSRARNLHKASRFVVDTWDGSFPSDAKTLQEMPGVGRYTAGAIASIAFGTPAPIVDGNVIRVLSRLCDLEEEVSEKLALDRIWRWAETLVDPQNASAFNQGMMELGAILCTPTSPGCEKCPWREPCRSRAAGTVLERPVKKAKRPPKKVALVACVIRDERGSVLLTQRPEKGLFGGLWEVPLAEVEKAPSQEGVGALVEESTGLHVKVFRQCTSVRHVLTHRDMDIAVFEASVEGSEPSPILRSYTGGRWIHSPEALEDLGVGRVTRKILEVAGADGFSAQEA
jgi:A/G-specific adenine glycosylase